MYISNKYIKRKITLLCMAVRYKQKCWKCKKNYVLITGKQRYAVCYYCQKDQLKGEISNKSTFTLKDTGPIEPGKFFESFWHPFYNTTTTCIEIRKVIVEYFDGTKFVYVNDLKKILDIDSNINLKNGCAYKQ